MLYPILFALGCANPSQDNANPPVQQQTPPSTVEPSTESGLTVLGFNLGQMQTAEVEAQLAKLDIPCPSKDGLTKKVSIYDCRTNLTIEDLAPRVVRGSWENLFLVKGDDNPLHYISLTRKYSIPSAIVEDYNSTFKYIESVLGPASKVGEIDVDKVDSPIYRTASFWESDSIKVELSVMKMGTPTVSLYEKWTHIPLNTAVKEREGQSGHMKNTVKDYKGTVKVLDSKDGITSIETVFADREQLKDKEIAVQGTVVKSNAVFGTNWYHIQDGSGSAESENHDLTVTSDDSANIGDSIIIRGSLTVDKDFGFGYFYPAIIEGGKVEIISSEK